jgi:hypothetical protein
MEALNRCTCFKKAEVRELAYLNFLEKLTYLKNAGDLKEQPIES